MDGAYGAERDIITEEKRRMRADELARVDAVTVTGYNSKESSPFATW